MANVGLAICKNIQRLNLPPNVCLLAVSKGQPADCIIAAYRDGGACLFGENYVNELLAKHGELSKRLPEYAEKLRWHFIGRLQSNKISALLSIPTLACIETLVSTKHLGMLEYECEKMDRAIDLMIEVNSSGEASKGGLPISDYESIKDHFVFCKAKGCVRVKLVGLMTIGSLAGSSKEFIRMKELADALQCDLDLEAPLRLSMGMSADYGKAIEAGSTEVRIGTALFGARLSAKAEQ